jgi:thiamine pyrophosphate-dependent acetolactate synthase large subunit-like protein
VRVAQAEDLQPALAAALAGERAVLLEVEVA